VLLLVALQVTVSSFPKVLDGESSERVTKVSFDFSVIAFVLGPDKGMLVGNIASVLFGCFGFASD